MSYNNSLLVKVQIRCFIKLLNNNFKTLVIYSIVLLPHDGLLFACKLYLVTLENCEYDISEGSERYHS